MWQLLPLWFLPLSQVVFNLLYFTYSLMHGQVKGRVLAFAFMYGGTIAAARRGDLSGYFALRVLP